MCWRREDGYSNFLFVTYLRPKFDAYLRQIQSGNYRLSTNLFICIKCKKAALRLWSMVTLDEDITPTICVTVVLILPAPWY